jgi:hypothetical protein
MRLVLTLAAASCFAAAPALASDELARGDAAWARRAEGERGGLASSERVDDAVGAYQRALDANPDDLELRWKLLRALHFHGEFATRDDEQARAIFARGREVAEWGLERLSGRVGTGERLEQLDQRRLNEQLAAATVTRRDVGRLYFWSAVHWGAWARREGLLLAVREGVANRIHRYALVALAFDPEYEEGGPYRLLGSLHAQLPRVPFVTGWIDRARAIPLLERAVAIGPAHPGNHLLLALALLDLAPTRRGEALALLEQAGAAAPRQQMRVEDLAVRRAAHERRLRLEAESGARTRAGGVT